MLMLCPPFNEKPHYMAPYILEQSKTDSEYSESSTEEDKIGKFNLKMNRIMQATIDGVDKYDINDPLCCAEYINEIFQHMLKTEAVHLPKPGYMKLQRDINERMRGILIDWLAEVHLKFKLLPETLYL